MAQNGEIIAMPVPDGAAIEICEVGPRDGFQIEKAIIPTDRKIAIVNELIDAGLKKIQVTSFVSPRAVPQLADAAEVLAGVEKKPGVVLSALVPNAKGAERAAKTQVDIMGLFCSASEAHSLKNVNASIEATLARFPPVVEIAKAAGKRVQGGVATVFGCPFEGEVPPEAVVRIARFYRDLGIVDLNLGDTTGMATPATVKAVLAALRQAVPEMAVTLHFHNTRGVGLANVMVGLSEGITRYDSSIGGLGGCPFAAGATGNICTEDLVYLLQESGYRTGVDLDRLIGVARLTQDVIGRELPGQVMKAGPRLTRHGLDDVSTAAG
ncbi:hydroxymethylglutaryl-CoA lyase [Aurantimonas sp. VKM B-3413]|uniref:hydroxymethylglutaryl-CoA lyase n=1 Tax=Aurantimonas sp. VKM B-3413 TaxID=2779401 RepID=UPI001E2DF2A6|nr:hydroxymethylglutaryl-CoA lyase [Aurantimonas sp. VKM B-3413]MCB8836581.1 hydroxymethylglutaryl-CoA lyase [Aurantimonas sp. VKM B-3413]